MSLIMGQIEPEHLYVTIRSRMSSIMDLIGPELSQVICPWIRKFAIFDFVYTLACANIDQSVPNLANIRSWMSLIMGQIEPEHLYVTIRSRMSSIMDLIGPELSKLSALELENLPYLTLFTL